MTAPDGGPPSGGGLALAEVRVRVEIIADRVRGYVRAKAPRRRPRVYACRLCLRKGHGRGTCRLRHLDMWTDGHAVALACSPRAAAEVIREAWHVPLTRTGRGDPYPLAADADDRFTLAGVTATLKAWARANGRGLLTTGGVLLPGRKVPR